MPTSDTVVLDFKWHGILYCNKCSSLRAKYSHFSTVLRSIKENSVEQNVSRESRDTDLRHLFRSLPFVTGTINVWLRQAATVSKTWLSDVSVRGRLCAPPPHWNLNIFSQPLVDSDVPVNVTGDFDSGRPWHFADLVQ